MNRRFVEAPTGVYWVQGEQLPRFIKHQGVVFQKGVHNWDMNYLNHAKEIASSTDKVIPMLNTDFYLLWHKAKHAENIPEAFAAAVAAAMLEGTLEQYQQTIDNSAA